MNLNVLEDIQAAHLNKANLPERARSRGGDCRSDRLDVPAACARLVQAPFQKTTADDVIPISVVDDERTEDWSLLESVLVNWQCLSGGEAYQGFSRQRRHSARDTWGGYQWTIYPMLRDSRRRRGRRT